MEAEHEKLEFFKLDDIDRKVLLWLLEHVHVKSITAWTEYIAEQYRLQKNITIDPIKLFEEMIGDGDAITSENKEDTFSRL